MKRILSVALLGLLLCLPSTSFAQLNGGSGTSGAAVTTFWTTGGTFTLAANAPSGTTTALVCVTAVGGGGGGGGVNANTGGAGGGSGGEVVTKCVPVTSSQTVTIGDGGTAGIVGVTNGGDGTATTFGSAVTARPGLGKVNISSTGAQAGGIAANCSWSGNTTQATPCADQAPTAFASTYRVSGFGGSTYGGAGGAFNLAGNGGNDLPGMGKGGAGGGTDTTRGGGGGGGGSYGNGGAGGVAPNGSASSAAANSGGGGGGGSGTSAGNSAGGAGGSGYMITVATKVN